MNEQPISFPGLADPLVASVNSVASCTEITLPEDGEDRYAVRSALCTGPYERQVTVVVSIAGSSIRVHLDSGAIECAVGDLLPPPAFAQLACELQAAVLQATLARPMAAASGLLGAEVLLSEVLPRTDDVHYPSAAEFLLEIRRASLVVCTVVVELDTPLPPSVVDTLGGFRRPLDCAGIPFPVTFEVGRTSLAKRDLRSVEPGDIVLFDRCYIDGDALRVNVADRFSMMGSVAGLELTVQSSG